MDSRPPYLAVVGGHPIDGETARLARDVGREVARAGAVLVCGGLGGVMASACRGAQEAGGLTIGILPGLDRAEANDWVDIAITTGLGEMRNFLVVRNACAVVAVDGEYGTLSEIAYALKAGLPVVGLRTWGLRTWSLKHTVPRRDRDEDDPIVRRDDPAEAVREALRLAEAR